MEEDTGDYADPPEHTGNVMIFSAFSLSLLTIDEFSVLWHTSEMVLPKGRIC